MEESYIKVLSAFTRSLVDETDSLFLTEIESICYTILNAECDVVYAFVSLVYPLLDSALWRCRLEKLKLHLATLQESGLNLLVFYDLGSVAFKTKNISKIRKRFFNALDCDAQMLNVRDFHDDKSLSCLSCIER